jgi:hypothetical protein
MATKNVNLDVGSTSVPTQEKWRLRAGEIHRALRYLGIRDHFDFADTDLYLNVLLKVDQHGLAHWAEDVTLLEKGTTGIVLLAIDGEHHMLLVTYVEP